MSSQVASDNKAASSKPVAMGAGPTAGPPAFDASQLSSASTAQRAGEMQSRIAQGGAKSRIKGLRSFAQYEPNGTGIRYCDNKVGVMPNVDDVVMEIANEGGIDISDPATMSNFVDALVTDIYNNPYSDKQSFEGEIVVADGTFVFPRRHIKTVIEKYVATNYRRFARAMAEVVVQVMHDNPMYNELLDKKCNELNLSTRAEAVRHFDGADALIIVDRTTAMSAASEKIARLSRRPLGREYAQSDSSVHMGEHMVYN